MDDLSDEQACFIAGISHQTLYNYQKENPEFVERKKALKESVKIHVKQNLANAVRSEKNGKYGVETTRWYAERKMKDEGFSSRTEITGADGEKLIPTEEDKKKSRDAINNYLKKHAGNNKNP